MSTATRVCCLCCWARLSESESASGNSSAAACPSASSEPASSSLPPESSKIRSRTSLSDVQESARSMLSKGRRRPRDNTGQRQAGRHYNLIDGMATRSMYLSDYLPVSPCLSLSVLVSLPCERALRALWTRSRILFDCQVIKTGAADVALAFPHPATDHSFLCLPNN